MLGITNNKYQAKIIKDLSYQFIFLVEKIEDSYQTLFNLVKIT